MKGPQKSYCDMVDEALLAKQEAEQKSGDTYFPLRPSSAGYCGRKLAYELAANEKIIEKRYETRKPSIIRLLSLGHGIEYHVLRYLDSIPGYKVKFKQQVVSLFNLPSGRLIEGSVDAVMWPSDPTLTPGLLDVKSVGDRWAQAYQSAWDQMKAKYERMQTVERFGEDAFYVKDPIAFLNDVGEDALVANIMQINLYGCSSFMKERKVDHGIVMRYNKNSSKHMEVRFDLSDDLYEYVKEKFCAIETSVMEKRDPALVDRDFALGSQACAFCPYADMCWEGANTKKPYYNTLPKKRWATRIGELGDDKVAAELKEMFDKVMQAESVIDQAKAVEGKILTRMANLRIQRIKLDENNVFEAKELKSPKPHFELRRTKE